MQQFDHRCGPMAMQNLHFRVLTPIHWADTGQVRGAPARGFQSGQTVLSGQWRAPDYTWGLWPSRSRPLECMEFFSLILLLAAGIHWLNTQGQRKRTALLADHLRPYQIEKHMEQLTSAYMRALGEKDPERQQQILQLQESAEQQLASEFQNLSRAFAKLPAPITRGFKLALPFIDQLSPKASFDMRRMLEVHAQGLSHTVANAQGLGLKERAFQMMGEMFLMQHSCHWFCKSKTIASARMVALHNTRYEQALNAASRETQNAYLAVAQG